jgi:hypothetical protein
MANSLRKLDRVSTVDALCDDAFYDGVELLDEPRAPRADRRLGQPLRFCMLCGEQDPVQHGAQDLCLHGEIAVFAECSQSVLDAMDRLQASVAELTRSRKVTDSVVRAAVQQRDAVVDRREIVTPLPTPILETACETCAERAQNEAVATAKKSPRASKRRSKFLAAATAMHTTNVSADATTGQPPLQFELEFVRPTKAIT